MTDKAFRRMNRSDLVQIIFQYQQKDSDSQKLIEDMTAQINDRRLRIQQSGSVAEAALSVNHVMEAAQAAADQYLEEVRLKNAYTDDEAAKVIADAQKQAEQIIAAAKESAAQLITKTQTVSKQYMAKTEQTCNAKLKKTEDECKSLILRTQAQCDALRKKTDEETAATKKKLAALLKTMQ